MTSGRDASALSSQGIPVTVPRERSETDPEWVALGRSGMRNFGSWHKKSTTSLMVPLPPTGGEGLPDSQNPKTGVFLSYSKSNRSHASSSCYSQGHYYPHFTDGETKTQRGEGPCQALLGKLVSMHREDSL